MKKHIVALAAFLAFNMTGYAAEPTVDITSISADSGVITVEAANNLGKDSRITLRVIRKDDVPVDADKYYAVMQAKAAAGKTVEFEFTIPDEKLSLNATTVIRGSGTYEVSVYSEDKVGDTEVYLYADSSDVEAFFTELKEAADKVTDATKAYEELDDVVDKEDYRVVLASMGVDYDTFSAESAAVQQGTLNSLYDLGIDTLTKETIAKAFQGVYGLNIFNYGDRTEGLEYLKPTYNGKEPEEKYENAALGLMTEVYVSIEDFELAYATAYGLSVLKTTNINEIEGHLDIFKIETGLCTTNINKIKALSTAKKENAYEYAILSLSKGEIKTAAQLDDLLDEAYKAASKTTALGGGGGGGGSMGGSSNRIPAASTSVSTPIGSGTVDEKKEATVIFSDLPIDHWAAESVDYLKKAGIVSGTDTGAFEPDRLVTREEFAKMLVAACGFETENRKADFADADGDAWYAKYVGAAVENGVVNGIGDNKFGVGQNITRQDMAVMTARAIEKKSVVLSKLKDYIAFSDETVIADYAFENIKVLYEAGIINGKGSNMFEPLGNATRAEAAKIIYEAFKGVTE